MPRLPHPRSLNVQFLKDLRGRLEWSQEELAAKSNVSVRLVAKAEAGEKVSAKSMRAFVNTFQLAGLAIDAGDLATNPEFLARQFLTNYATHQADCVEHCRSFLSPDIVAFVDGDPKTNPIAGTYRGIEEFDGLWKKFFAIFVRDGGSLVENPETRCIGNEVFAWGHESIRVPEAEPRPPGFVSLRMLFQAGLMTYFEDHYEVYGMMMQLTRWAQEFPEGKWLDKVDRKALLKGSYLDAVPPASPPPPEIYW